MPNVVLIVGESAFRDFMGVYGYVVPNTPNLNALVNGGGGGDLPNLFVFDNVISSFGNTEENFEVLLNYADTETQPTPWYNQRDLGDIFNLAGYSTFWLDNQYPARDNSATELLPRRFKVVLRTYFF